MSARFRTVYIPFLLVFVSGTVVGGFGHRLYTINTVKADTRSGPEEFRRRYVEEMRTRLALNEDQLARLNVILDDTRQKFKALHEQNKPSINAIKDEQVVRISAILADNQRTEYAKLREERERKRLEKERQDQEREEKGKAARTRR